MKISTKTLVRSALILALAMAIQSVRMPAYFTGPLINTLLFLAAALINPVGGVLVGLLTPFLAFSFGILAVPAIPLIPVIMAGNALLVIVFGLLLKKPVLGVAAASFTKYIVMALGVSKILPLLLNIKLPPKVLYALSTQQLFTALAGGIIALIIIKTIDWKRIVR
jgi:hypothetical protein